MSRSAKSQTMALASASSPTSAAMKRGPVEAMTGSLAVKTAPMFPRSREERGPVEAALECAALFEQNCMRDDGSRNRTGHREVVAPGVLRPCAVVRRRTQPQVGRADRNRFEVERAPFFTVRSRGRHRQRKDAPDGWSRRQLLDFESRRWPARHKGWPGRCPKRPACREW